MSEEKVSEYTKGKREGFLVGVALGFAIGAISIGAFAIVVIQALA